MIASENLYIEKGENPFSKYMSRYAIKRKSNKIGEKGPDLYLHICLFRSIFSMLEVCQLRHTRDTAFQLGKIWMDRKDMEFRSLPFRGIDIRQFVSISKEQRQDKV